MGIVSVTVFRTTDGKQFDTKEKAQEHEVTLQSVAKLRTVLSSSLSTMRPEAVMHEMLLQSVAIADILRSHQRKLPRGKTAK